MRILTGVSLEETSRGNSRNRLARTGARDGAEEVDCVERRTTKRVIIMVERDVPKSAASNYRLAAMCTSIE